MDTKRIRKQAEERIGFGYARQHVFDELMLENPQAKPKKIAEVVRYIPSLAARERYKVHHQGLLAAIVAYAALQLARPLLDGDFDKAGTFEFFRLLPFATIFLGVAVYRWRGEMLPWLAFMNAFSVFPIMNDFGELAKGTVDPWEFARHLLSVTIAALALYLSSYMYPKYTEEKDPLGQMPPRIVFPPEPGMSMM